MTKEEKFYRQHYGLPITEIPKLGSGDKESITLLKEWTKQLKLNEVNRSLRGLYLWQFEAWIVNNCSMNGESGIYKYLDGAYTKTDLLYKYLEVIKDNP